MHFKPFSVTVDGKRADVSHVGGSLCKIIFDGKEMAVMLEFPGGKPQWTYAFGKATKAEFNKVIRAIEAHMRPKK